MPAPWTLLLTRPRAQSEDFAAVVAQALPGRFRSLVSPLLEIAPVDAPLDLDGAQGLVFTSANGVAQFAARTSARGLPAYCVGDHTAEAARRAGFEARAAGGDVEALGDLVTAAHRPGGGVFLHVRGRHAAGDLVGRLAAAGVPARAAEIYDQAPCALSPAAAALLGGGAPLVAPLFSARTARLFAEACRAGRWNLRAVSTVALSPNADAALGELAPGCRQVAARPTRDGMLAALADVRDPGCRLVQPKGLA